MSLNSEERNAIVAYRIEKAKSTLLEAEGIVNQGYWNAAANRLYYAAYYMVSALLIKNGFSAQSHSGVISLFSLHFVKTQKISKELGKIYSQLFELRLTGDYDDLYNLDEERVKPFVELTKKLLDELEKLF